jgi:hypothetical protein
LQVGGALGVAVVGIVFFGGIGDGVAHAFRISLILLAALTSATAALTQLLSPSVSPVPSVSQPVGSPTAR